MKNIYDCKWKLNSIRIYLDSLIDDFDGLQQMAYILSIDDATTLFILCCELQTHAFGL